MVFPVFGCDFQERLRLGDSSVVHQHVNPAQLAHRARDELLHLTIIAHVCPGEERFASKLFDFVRSRLRRVFVDVGDADIRALASKAERYFLADTASRASHQYDLILKLHGITSAPRCAAVWEKLAGVGGNRNFPSILPLAVFIGPSNAATQLCAQSAGCGGWAGRRRSDVWRFMGMESRFGSTATSRELNFLCLAARFEVVKMPDGN